VVDEAVVAQHSSAAPDRVLQQYNVGVWHEDRFAGTPKILQPELIAAGQSSWQRLVCY
jgi:hypothetical protein